MTLSDTETTNSVGMPRKEVDKATSTTTERAWKAFASKLLVLCHHARTNQARPSYTPCSNSQIAVAREEIWPLLPTISLHACVSCLKLCWMMLWDVLFLERLRQIYCSPLLRALQTAHLALPNQEGCLASLKAPNVHV